MANKKSYYARGTLNDCLLALVARAGSLGTNYLAIVRNDRSNYYGLVDEAYLNDPDKHPTEDHMHIILHINDTELQIFHDTFEALQGDMFDPPPTTIPPA